MTARGDRPPDEPPDPRPDAGDTLPSFEGEHTRQGMGFAGVVQPTLIDAPTGAERSEPIRVFSMKEQTGRRVEAARSPLHVQLRSLGEISRQHDTPPVGLGRLAPPRDPHQARARRLRGNVGWVVLALVLAAAISLAIWLAAGR